VRILELLKLRFGESNMQNCEVMLKDVANSKRINTAIKKAALEKKEATAEDEEQVNVH
jgi:anaphase-promoting complex subunit 2